ncbi:MAG: hypothetical protein AMS27_13525, partial [Bacteroides sp. SM23_62_1]
EDYFGCSVSISGDYAVVGARGEDEDASGLNTMLSSGSAYVFYKDQGGTDNWGQVKKIVASDRAIEDNFGESVSISGDYVIIGASGEDDDTLGGNTYSSSGSAYIFYKDQGGTDNWGQVKKIVAGDRNEYDGFGFSVSIDSDYALVGAPWKEIFVTVEGEEDEFELGSAYLFYKNQSGVNNWGQIEKLVASEWTYEDDFGYSVSITGEYAIAGVHERNNQQGISYVFQYAYQASNIIFNETRATQFTIEWTNGNMARRAVFIKSGNTGMAYPVDSTTYYPDSIYGSGTQIGSTGWYCIYSDTGTSVTVTGLTPGMEYRVMVCEYNGSAGSERYYTSDTTNNPANQIAQMDLSGMGINVAGGQITNTNTSMQYSLNSTNGTDGDWFDCTFGNTSVIFGVCDVYVREKVFIENYRFVASIATPASAPSFTINYFTETTTESIPPTIEYNSDNNFSTPNTDGTEAVVSLSPGIDMYFRFKATASALPSEIQTLDVPERPAMTSYSIDYFSEKTVQSVVSTEEYSINPDMNPAITGTFQKVDLIPGTDVYFRIKATGSSFSGTIQHLVVPERPAATVYSIDYLSETTNENILSTDEYSENSDMSGASGGSNAKIDLTPGTDMYFRTKATVSSFSGTIQHLIVPGRPETNYSIGYLTETTAEDVTSTDEYSVYSDMSDALSGPDTKINLTPGTDIYFRTKVTDSTFSGTIQQLIVPDRPAVTTYSIDYFSEKTAENVISTDEYSINPDMSGAIAGIYEKAELIPGSDLYFRTKATGSSFSGEIQHLQVPDRPDIPTVSLSDKNSGTARFKNSSDGTGTDVSAVDGFEYSMDHGTTWNTILDLTTVDASGIKSIIVRKKATASSFKSLPTDNLDAEDPVATVISTTGCNGPTNYVNIKSNIDTGTVYLILDGEPQSGKGDFNTAIASNKGSKFVFHGANVNLAVPTTGLVAGNYYAYIVNIIDSISEKSTDAIIIRDIPALDLGNDITKCDVTEVTLDPGIDYTSYSWSYNDATTRSIQVTEENDYILTVTDEHGCQNSDTISVRYNIPYQEEKICIVTIDLATGKNLIVWEKTPGAGVVAYNIYRETIIGEYNIIGTTAVTDLSVFLDTTGDPESQSYLYKITVVDTCGKESEIANSKYHRPSFLQYVSAIGGINLEWTDYNIQGTTDIGEYLTSYVIYRGTDSTGLSEYKTVGSINNFTDTDPDALKRRYYYRVAGVLKDACMPTAGKKADSEPYGHAFSNVEDNRLQDTSSVVTDLGVIPFTIYPNPFDESTTILFNNPGSSSYSLYIFDLTGKVCQIIDNITTSEYVLEKGDLKEGFYFMELRGPGIYRGKILIE